METLMLLFAAVLATMASCTLIALITSFSRNVSGHLATVFFATISSAFAVVILLSSKNEQLILLMTTIPIGFNIIAVINSIIHHFFLKDKNKSIQVHTPEFVE